MTDEPCPEHRPPRVFGVASLALLAAALVFHFLPFPWPTNRFDTGIHLAAAQLIRAGQQPFVDFQTLYAPGSYVLLARTFDVFGATFDVHSALDFTLLALNAWVAWHVAARAGAGGLHALVAFAAGLAFTYPFPSLLLALVAVLVAARPADRDPWRRAILAGFVCALAGWFRQDVGAVGAAAAALAAAVAATRAPVPATLRTLARREGPVGRGGAMAPIECGPTARAATRRVALAATVLAAAAVSFAAILSPALAVDAHAVWEGLVVNPLATVPFRDSTGALVDAVADPAFGVPVAAAAIGVVLAAAGSVRAARAGHGDGAGTLAGLAVVAAWSVRYVALRADGHHLVPAGIVGAVVCVAAFPPGGRGRIAQRAAFALACVAVTLPLARGVAARGASLLGRRDGAVAGVGDLMPGARTLHLRPDEAADWTRLVVRLRALVARGPFLSACARHDRVMDQDLLLYFAVGTLPPVRHFHFDPGVTTRADVQREIVADSERAGVRVIVRYDSRNAEPPPGTPPGATLLDAWIAERFQRAERIGRYEIWTR